MPNFLRDPAREVIIVRVKVCQGSQGTNLGRQGSRKLRNNKMMEQGDGGDKFVVGDFMPRVSRKKYDNIQLHNMNSKQTLTSL